MTGKKKITYSTNWMGVASTRWYIERGLTRKKLVTFTENSLSVKCGDNKPGDTFEVDEPIQRYSCGRLDVRGTGDPYGDEIGVPPMKEEDWYRFGDWLDNFSTHKMWNLEEIVKAYEQTNPPIQWYEKPRWES